MLPCSGALSDGRRGGHNSHIIAPCGGVNEGSSGLPGPGQRGVGHHLGSVVRMLREPRCLLQGVGSLGDLSRFPDYPGKPGAMQDVGKQQDEGMRSRRSRDLPSARATAGGSSLGDKITTEY